MNVHNHIIVMLGEVQAVLTREVSYIRDVLIHIQKGFIVILTSTSFKNIILIVYLISVNMFTTLLICDLLTSK